MACACCRPLDLKRLVASNSTIQLTVRLLSGAILAKLAVEPKTVVADLKLQVEQAAKLPAGQIVRWLLWGRTQLQDEDLLQDMGLSAREDLVALCADAIVGDFEVYVPGCPTCDYNSDLQRVRFFEDGTAWIQQRYYDEGTEFRYTVGELRGHERQLTFVEDTSDAPAQYDGILQLSATNSLKRRLKIPELDIDVEDVRYLKEKGESFLQQKMEIMLEFGYAEQSFFDPFSFSVRHLPTSAAVLYSDEEAWEAYSQAWTSVWQTWKKRQEWTHMEEKISWKWQCLEADLLEGAVPGSKKRRVHGKRGKRDLLRWQRPRWTADM